jgi:cytochrome d ubiquinol oxidase subunit I
VLAEFGRQPWAVEGVLPTFLGASSLTVPELWITIVGFTLIYGVLAVIEVGLIIKVVKRGPNAIADPEIYVPTLPAAAATVE